MAPPLLLAFPPALEEEAAAAACLISSLVFLRRVTSLSSESELDSPEPESEAELESSDPSCDDSCDVVEGFRFFCCCWNFFVAAAPASLAADLGGVDFLVLAGGAVVEFEGFSLEGAMRPD